MLELIGDLNQIFEYLSGQAVWWGLVVLALSAIVEYVFPPFPGDTVTLAGAVLIPRAGWPIWGVFGAVMLGTAIGTAIDWRVGIWLADHQHGDTWLHEWLSRERVASKIRQVKDQFERYGSIYLLANRFVPAFRSVFFVAAGLSRLSLAKVLGFGVVSAALWNAVLMGVGYGVGYKLTELAAIVDSYSRVFFGVLLTGATIWSAKLLYDLVCSRPAD